MVTYPGSYITNYATYTKTSLENAPYLVSVDDLIPAPS